MFASGGITGRMGLWLGVVFLLASCTDLNGNETALGKPPGKHVEDGNPSKPEKISKPVESDEQKVYAKPNLATVLMPRRRTVLQPSDVVGRSEGDVEKLFGSPRIIEEKPPAIVWRYPSQTCNLSLFFYMDVNSKSFRVLTFEVEPKTKNAEICMNNLQKGSG